MDVDVDVDATSPDRAPLPTVVIGYQLGLPAQVERAKPEESGDEQPGQQAHAYAIRGEGGELLVVTYGSSRCPQLPASVQWTGPETLTMTTRMYRPCGPCTRDFVPTTSVVRLPDGVDFDAVRRVVIDGQESGVRSS